MGSEAEEFEQRYHLSARLSGTGLNTKAHVPCPFCAAPDWLVHRLLDAQKAYRKGAVCSGCGRGARARVDVFNGTVSIELVQTVGDDPPPWVSIERE